MLKNDTFVTMIRVKNSLDYSQSKILKKKNNFSKSVPLGQKLTSFNESNFAENAISFILQILNWSCTFLEIAQILTTEVVDLELAASNCSELACTH